VAGRLGGQHHSGASEPELTLLALSRVIEIEWRIRRTRFEDAEDRDDQLDGALA
jgi:hypothetical protein